MEDNKSIFEELLAVDVEPFLTKKKVGNGKELSYMSWTYAWAEIKRRYPDATYKIWRDDRGLPYAYDDNTGYMVFVTLIAGGQEFPCFLPVMDENCCPMKAEEYTYTRSEKGDIVSFEVQPATMFEINTTIMRCLVKACAMAGLGLCVFAGEDINAFNAKVASMDDKKNRSSVNSGMNDSVNSALLESHREATYERFTSLGIKEKSIMRQKFPGRDYEDLNEAELNEIDEMCNNYERQRNEKAQQNQ